MHLRTVLWGLFWIFLAWFIITNPHQAAAAAHNIGHLFTQAATGVSSFLANL